MRYSGVRHTGVSAAVVGALMVPVLVLGLAGCVTFVPGPPHPVMSPSAPGMFDDTSATGGSLRRVADLCIELPTAEVAAATGADIRSAAPGPADAMVGASASPSASPTPSASPSVRCDYRDAAGGTLTALVVYGGGQAALASLAASALFDRATAPVTGLGSAAIESAHAVGIRSGADVLVVSAVQAAPPPALDRMLRFAALVRGRLG